MKLAKAHKPLSLRGPLACLALLFTLLAPHVVAEPYLAQRYGQQCSACHTNMTGGGKRTDVGVAYTMGMTGSPISTSFSPKLAEGIAIGGNFRSDWTYTQFDDPELDENGNSTGALEDTSAFNISNGLLYLGFDLSPKITVYLDQQVAPEGGRTREAFGLYRGAVTDKDYVKVGKFFLPFGLRLQDDKAFIRESTGFNFDNSDIGIEYGIETGSWSLSAALSNGTQGSGETNTDKQFSMAASYVQPRYRLGISAAKNNGLNGVGVEAIGVFAGYTHGKWVFLGELDYLENSSGVGENATATNQLVSFLSVNYLVSPSTNLKFSYDFLDPNDDIDENERTRFSLLGETFLNQFTQVRYGIRRQDGIPQNTFQNQSLVFSELHLFF